MWPSSQCPRLLTPKGRSQRGRGDAEKRDEIKTEDTVLCSLTVTYRLHVCTHTPPATCNPPDLDSCCWDSHLGTVVCVVEQPPKAVPRWPCSFPALTLPHPNLGSFWFFSVLCPLCCLLLRPSFSAVSTSESLPDLHPPGPQALWVSCLLGYVHMEKQCSLALSPSLSSPLPSPSSCLSPSGATSVTVIAMFPYMVLHSLQTSNEGQEQAGVMEPLTLPPATLKPGNTPR